MTNTRGGVHRAGARGIIAPSIQALPANEVGVSPLRAFDLKLSWVHKFSERLSIEPGVGFYNLFNFTNYALPPNIISGLLTGNPGSTNGTTPADRITNRVGGKRCFLFRLPASDRIGNHDHV
jgi:hypothetical protein